MTHVESGSAVLVGNGQAWDIRKVAAGLSSTELSRRIDVLVDKIRQGGLPAAQLDQLKREAVVYADIRLRRDTAECVS